jgi:hypothetical protein
LKQKCIQFSQGRVRKYKSRRCNKDFALEQTFERILNPTLPFPVLIKGNVDRIEERNREFGLLTIKLVKKSVTFEDMEGLTEEIKTIKSFRFGLCLHV